MLEGLRRLPRLISTVALYQRATKMGIALNCSVSPIRVRLATISTNFGVVGHYVRPARPNAQAERPLALAIDAANAVIINIRARGAKPTKPCAAHVTHSGTVQASKVYLLQDAHIVSTALALRQINPDR